MKIIGTQIESKIQATNFSKDMVTGSQAEKEMQDAIGKADMASY